MNFEPQKFFIGLIDFFSVLLPGAIVAYLLKISELSVPVVNDLRATSGTQGVAAFLVVSYLLGHFIFLLGAWLDEAYDMARSASLNKRIRRLALRGRLSSKWTRGLLWLVFKQESDAAVELAARIKAAYLDTLQARSAINTYQWAKLQLSAEYPDALATVQRFEADQKFFRSLSVVLALILGLTFLRAVLMATDAYDQPPTAWQQVIWSVLVTVSLLSLAMWRYAEQRLKATNQAYWAIISLEGRRGKITINPYAPKPDEPTHAGGVVYKRTRRDVQYLVVEATDAADDWVLPKGHIERGEDARITAVREVHEETGVWAKIKNKAGLAQISYNVEGEAVRVKYFLMEYLEQRRPTDRDRQSYWLSLSDARNSANIRHEEIKRLLESAAATCAESNAPR